MAIINFDVLRRAAMDPNNAGAQRVAAPDNVGSIPEFVRGIINPINAQNLFNASASQPIPGLTSPRGPGPGIPGSVPASPGMIPQQFPIFQGGMLSQLARRMAMPGQMPPGGGLMGFSGPPRFAGKLSRPGMPIGGMPMVAGTRANRVFR